MKTVTTYTETLRSSARAGNLVASLIASITVEIQWQLLNNYRLWHKYSNRLSINTYWNLGLLNNDFILTGGAVLPLRLFASVSKTCYWTENPTVSKSWSKSLEDEWIKEHQKDFLCKNLILNNVQFVSIFFVHNNFFKWILARINLLCRCLNQTCVWITSKVTFTYFICNCACWELI